MDFLSMTASQVEGLPEAKAQEVLDAWVKAKQAELPAALTQSASKAHAKLAKKALYQLQSQGVQAAPPKKDESAKPASDAPKNEFPAVLSMQLGTGERAFLFAQPIQGGGGLEVFQGIVHDELGLAQFGSEKASRNLYRRRMNELERDPQARVMLVPFERLLLELGRAITLNERTKAPYNADIEKALHRVGVTRQEPDFPIPPLEASDANNLEDGARLHELFEVSQWLPSEKDLVSLTQRADALRTLPLPEEQKTAKIEQTARELANEVFTPAVRTLYARRLMHQATPSRFAEQLFVKVLSTLPKTAPAAGAMPAMK